MLPGTGRDTPPAATPDQLWQYVKAAWTAVPPITVDFVIIHTSQDSFGVYVEDGGGIRDAIEVMPRIQLNPRKCLHSVCVLEPSSMIFMPLMFPVRIPLKTPIGSLIEETVDLAKQIILEVDSDDIQANAGFPQSGTS
ncbi:hypothetical protein TNCV_2008371 [Trichonephila clavipes]|nr:hypothetical protein TNCV_2008371 [Trichonephila clavipes]